MLGDAYMRPEDAQRASNAVLQSLEQFVNAFENQGPYANFIFDRKAGTGLDLATPDTLDVCSNNYLPFSPADPKLTDEFVDVLKHTPISALKPGYGELPRFRAELGAFLGVSTAMRAASWHSGFSPDQTTPGGSGGIGMNFRVGLGLDGIINESGDGLVFLDVGIFQDGASGMDFSDDLDFDASADLVAAIPSRQGLTARIRMPFWLLPGDLIIASPLLLISPDLYTQMAVIAGNGGLIPWQAGMVTDIGRFQFMLGREVGVRFFGYAGHENTLLVPGQDTSIIHVVTMRSIQVELPFIEYRPFRTFSVDQSSDIVIQGYVAADIPTVWWNNPDRDVPIDLRTIFALGIRIAFDWRYYL